MRKGARNAVAIASGQAPVTPKLHEKGPSHQMIDEQNVIDLGYWRSDDGGSFSDYDSEEEKRRLKRRRRRNRFKREGGG
jgi:hypothetical protein